MGSSLAIEEAIFYYYIFQQKLKLYLKGGLYKKDNTKIKEGYILHEQYVREWKKAINYPKIVDFLKESNICTKKISSEQKDNINKFIKDQINQNHYFYSTNTFFRANTRNILQVQEKILNENYLQRLVSDKIFESFKNYTKINGDKINYILKEKMMILFYPNYFIIKMLISDLAPYSEENKIVNLTFIFNYFEHFNKYQEIFRENSSVNILKFIITKGILDKYITIYEDSYGRTIFKVFNEEQYLKGKKQTTIQSNIKDPSQINFALVQRPSYRGLDNVGATCYMNATLQCLANIKPVTEALLKQKKYNVIYQNRDICRLTIEYCQVLIGLFCDNSPIGSYKPEEFKTTIGELNSLFQGVQANDSKDLIIFLLETLNSELVNLHNKIHNIKEIDSNIIPSIDPTNENQVFNEFQKEFSKSHHSVVGFNLCGIQKNMFTCNNCGKSTFNFNIFNFLIFGLETISNYFNLSNNNTQLPTITFDHCFKYNSKQETFDQTYCQMCKITGKSIYQEGVYMMPNYLIIILNRGKGNIFNCKVVIPESFSSANYEQISKNSVFELVGVVSHLGESGMGGHFIAFCKHSIDNIWRIYNDSTVVECQNDYLTKGTPYILFYKKKSVNGNINNSQNNNNQRMKAKTAIGKSNFNNNPNPIFDNFQRQNKMDFNNQQQNRNINKMNYFQGNMFMFNNNNQQMNNYQINLNLNNQNSFNNNMHPNMNINQNMNQNMNKNQNMNINQNMNQNMNINQNMNQNMNMNSNMNQNINQNMNMNQNMNINQNMNMNPNMNMNQNVNMYPNMNMFNNQNMMFNNNNNQFYKKNMSKSFSPY